MSSELNTQTYSQLVSNQVAAIQGSSSQLLDFEVGSILLAIVESNTGAVGLWVQALILALLATTRASTSSGVALDTWMADFNFYRLPAVSSTGNVTFARFTNTYQAVVLANETPSLSTQVQTADGTQNFYVTIDTSNSHYNAGLGGYVLASGTSSISVPVEAVVAGTGGNVAIGAISVLTSSIPFVDTVTNAAAFTNGVNLESDQAFRARFILYINTLSKATKSALEYAITSVQQNVQFNLTENYSYGGSPDLGNFYAVVDDGSHDPPTSFLNAVGSAVEATRGFTINYGIFADVTVTANVSMTITTSTGYTHSAVTAIVAAALSTYINTLGLGNVLYYTRLEQVAYDASPGVVDVYNVLLNSGTSDLAITNQQTAVPGTIVVS
jgi:uncharacterized phage protein gp47/JayE